jgi:membrane protease YdiL (CAAX protease family)
VTAVLRQWSLLVSTSLDYYAAAGHSPDWTYRFAGRVGAAFEIVFIGLFAGLVAGLLSGAFEISARSFLGQFEWLLPPSTDTSADGSSASTGILIDFLIGFLGGASLWAFLMLLGLRRMVVGLFLILTGWLLWTVVVMGGFVVYKLSGGLDIEQSLAAMTDFVGTTSPTAVIFQLSTFIGIWPATWFVAKQLHQQPFGTLFSPEGRIRWGDFGRGLLLAAGFWVVSLLLGAAVVGLPGRTELPLEAWAMAFAPLAIMVFVQASAEELIFRGYILQQLAVRWRNPLIWGALPAFLFGLAHYSSGTELGVSWEYVVVTLMFGITAAGLVWRTGSLAAAMGLHTGMNVFSLSATGLEGIIEGTQLFLYDASGAKTLFYADGAATLLLLLFVLSPLCPFRAREMTPAMP